MIADVSDTVTRTSRGSCALFIWTRQHISNSAGVAAFYLDTTGATGRPFDRDKGPLAVDYYRISTCLLRFVTVPSSKFN